jgi:hypothetical protein
MKSILAILIMFGVSAGWAADNPVPAPAPSITGKVLEVKDVDSYTYLRLKTKDGEMWAAVARMPVQKGADVVIENPMVMRNFESKALAKTFDKIVLGTLSGSGNSAAVAGGDMTTLHAGVAKQVDVGNIKVAKASGPDAQTVAEIVTKRAALKDKTVLVRGKVVKYTAGVLGKNWIHLRDGTGSAADKTDDVLVTSTDEARIGDVVLVKGIVHTDRDLGAGYSYKVLIEDATLQK